MTTSSPSASSSAAQGQSWYENAAAAQIHEEQLRRVELLNGRAAMLGFVIGVLTEALTGQGILQQIGLGTLFFQG
ncbi:MAG: chlorophyll a/b-binding protein [Cyanobium sp. CZS 48M]|nr:chlorophyll a/b-binding protein [Cyanobium sp. CZS48M]